VGRARMLRPVVEFCRGGGHPPVATRPGPDIGVPVNGSRRMFGWCQVCSRWARVTATGRMRQHTAQTVT
jgi:hypothetical protein